MKERHYPSDPFERLVKVVVEDSSAGRWTFDETYPYVDDSFAFKWHRFWHDLLMWTFVQPWNSLHFGLQIRGRGNLKFLGGRRDCISICNHVYALDALSVVRAVKPFGRMWIPMFPKHFNDRKYYWFIRYMGGIPVPENMAGMRKFNEAMDTYHGRGEWIHIFPEEVRWDFYSPIRPFRKGAFTMAYKYDCPLLPCVISWRERRGIYRLFGGKDTPCATITVCEPVFPDRAGTRKSEVDRMRVLAHERMVSAAGIGSNPWPSIPEEEK